jgi:hypothetical protein
MRSTLRTNFERESAALGSAMTIQPTHLDALRVFIFSALEMLSNSASATNVRWEVLEAGYRRQQVVLVPGYRTDYQLHDMHLVKLDAALLVCSEAYPCL